MFGGGGGVICWGVIGNWGGVCLMGGVGVGFGGGCERGVWWGWCGFLVVVGFMFGLGLLFSDFWGILCFCGWVLSLGLFLSIKLCLCLLCREYVDLVVLVVWLDCLEDVVDGLDLGWVEVVDGWL